MRLKPILDTRVKRNDDRYPIYIVLRDGKKVKYLPTGYRLEPKYWEKDKVSRKHPQAAVINAKIADLVRNISITVASADLTGRKVHFELIGSGKASPSFVEYIDKVAIDYEKRGKVVMAIKLAQRARELREVYGDVTFAELGAGFITRLDQHYEALKNSGNTRDKKMKVLGMLLRMAAKDGVYSGDNCFESYIAKREPTVKVSLTAAEISKLEKAKLTGITDLARDMFLFSYYCKGMRFGDVLAARREDIANGYIAVRDQKTGKPSSHQLHSRLKAIIKKYDGAYIFPLMDRARAGMDKYRLIKYKESCNAMINKYLRKAAARSGVKTVISMHIARHTFANQLKQLGVSPWVIKESLNHSSINTTENYLRQLGNAALDKEVSRLYGK